MDCFYRRVLDALSADPPTAERLMFYWPYYSIRTVLSFTMFTSTQKSLNQPKYAFLREILKRVDDLSFHTFNDKSEVIAPEEAEEDSVVVFDDVALEDQDAIRQYFAMGRHRSLDCFYLCQTYSKIPKQLVRDNANLIVLFKQDELNLKHAYNDHVNTDMSWEDFQEICKKCWEGRYTFLVIDKERDINKGRYRKGFDTFINTNYDDDDDDSDDV